MKIAACDFDGTLFRDGVVSEADLEAIADWRRSGNAFGIVTGRGRNTLLRDVKRFSIPYDFLICNNGAMICDEQAQDVYYAGKLTVRVLRGNCHFHPRGQDGLLDP